MDARRICCLLCYFWAQILLIVIHIFESEDLVAQQSEIGEQTQCMCVKLVLKVKTFLSASTKSAIHGPASQDHLGEKCQAGANNK